MSINNWMAWEGGVDLVALTDANLSMPNVIVHVARMVHTPVGSAPAGMIFWQPDATAAPVVMGFVSTDAAVGAYFGPKIFAGTPFENAPVLDATIDITIDGDTATARVETGGHVFMATLTGLAAAELINRAPGATSPFTQQGLERVPSSTTLTVDGAAVSVIVPPVGISGGPAAVVSPCGIYAR
jgi:hypothetical protein